MVKQFIQVKGNPQYARPIRPTAVLKCPATDVIELCQFPACEHFKGGPVYLKEGKHYGPNHGYGFQHIWQEHHAGETDRAQAEIKIFAVIRAVLIVGASIHHEGSPQDRASVSIRSPQGLVIVQENFDHVNAAAYHIVTAFPAQPKGRLIGRILKVTA
jgi:hypothetical protein